jgi:hypothetical protein
MSSVRHQGWKEHVIHTCLGGDEWVRIWGVLNVKRVTKNSKFLSSGVKFCRDLDFCVSFVSSALILHLTASFAKFLLALNSSKIALFRRFFHQTALKFCHKLEFMKENSANFSAIFGCFSWVFSVFVFQVLNYFFRTKMENLGLWLGLSKFCIEN